MGNTQCFTPNQTCGNNFCDNRCCDNSNEHVHSSQGVQSKIKNEKKNYFPIDCVGEILSFCGRSTEILNCLQVSHRIHEYITQYNPGCCRNVIFYFLRKPKNNFTTKKLFVYTLIIKSISVNFKGFKYGKIFKMFENVEILKVKKVDSITNEIFSHLKNLRSLKIKSCKKIVLNKDCLKHCTKLNEVTIENIKIDDDVFKNFKGKKLENLNILTSPSKIKGTFFNRISTLKKLSLTNHTVDDKSLEYLKNLEYLELQFCYGVKGSCFSHLKNLTFLRLFESTVEDEYLQLLKDLTILVLWRCSNATNSIFKYFPKLEKLQINSCPKIKNFKFTILKKLKILTLYSTNAFVDADIYKDEDFEDFDQLETLKLKNTESLTDKIFVDLKNLAELKIIGCSKITGTGFNGLDKLTVLTICGNNSVEDDIFKNMRSLTRLHIWSCQKIEGKTFSFLGKLKYLEINANYKITDESLEGLSRLEKLYIYKCPQFKGKIFKDLENLFTLWISENNNLKSESMKDLSHLRRLILNNCSNVGGDHFSELKSIFEMKVYHNSKIVAEDFLKVPGLKKLTIMGCPNIKEEGLRKLPANGVSEIWFQDIKSKSSDKRYIRVVSK